MQADRYFGKYVRFDTVSKREASIMVGSDNLVGDAYEIVFKTEDGTTTAWLKNRFDSLIGYLDESFSRQLQIFSARGWKIHALLAFFAYTDEPEPGEYWGQVAIMCYDPKYEHSFDNFINGVSKKLASGTRPDIALGVKGIDRVISSDGSWLPKNTVKLPSVGKETVIMKERRAWNERLIEQGRKGKTGCAVVSWVVLIAIIALIVFVVLFALRSCDVI